MKKANTIMDLLAFSRRWEGVGEISRKSQRRQPWNAVASTAGGLKHAAINRTTSSVPVRIPARVPFFFYVHDEITLSNAARKSIARNEASAPNWTCA